MECGKMYASCFNNYQCVSNVFMEKYGSHLAIKLFLKSCGKLPMFLRASYEILLHMRGNCQDVSLVVSLVKSSLS